MHIFYDPGLDSPLPGGTFILNPEESHHAVNVLRLTTGTVVQLVNGRGGRFTAELQKSDHRGSVLKMLSSEPQSPSRNHYLHLAVAPTKNSERFEWFLEKATEMGIDEITPLICDRSERKEVKTERLLKVIVAAMKQSQSATLPLLNDPVKFERLCVPADHQRFIAHCAAGEKKFISELAVKGSGSTVLIGPEGDFSTAEVALALEKGYQPVTLGESRLRTETAALAACFELNAFNR